MRGPWGGTAPLNVKKTPLFYLVYAIQFVGVFCAYYFAAQWSLSIGAINTFAAPLWPPTGIALAALYFGGFRLAPAVALAAFLVNYVTGAPIIAALLIALGNSLEAVVGIYLLRGFRFSPFFSRLSDSFSLIAIALSVPFISAIIGPLALFIGGELASNEILITSVTWWIGDALGALIVAPFLLKWFARPAFEVHRSIVQWLEMLLFFIALVLVSVIVFWQPIPALNNLSWPYLIFVPLTWGALRVGPRFVTSAIVIVAAIASIGTVMGVGPFSGLAGLHDLFFLQLFLGTIAMIFLLFVSTVEERKRNTQELVRETRDLREDVEEISEADRAKNEFIAILSHELRNPLAPVLSSLELLRLDIAKMPQYKETINTMYEQIGRITRLLDDLLDITRISKKKFSLEISRIRLQDVLDHSITTTSDLMRKKNHTLTRNIPKETLWIDADPLRLEQVFVNLLNNAAKYTNPGGTIALTAIPIKEGVEIRVRDNGLGIPQEMLRAIFEPFRQLHGRSQGSEGLGIGLSLSKRFVELHSGTIVAKSEGEGKGSELIVFLPTAQIQLLGEGHVPAKVLAQPAPSGHTSSPAGEARHPASPPEASPALRRGPTPVSHTWNLRKPSSVSKAKKKRSILIVDDNDDAAKGIAQLLNHAGHTARTALGGEEAMRVLSDFRPDIVFLDIGLPGESGYDLARRIRHYLSPSPMLVALTGYGQEEDKQRALDAGLDDHLTKPVSIADLEKVLTKVG